MNHPSGVWLSQIEHELKDNILSFWLRYAKDEEFGGFIGEISSSMEVIADAEKSLVLNARILWTFSTAYRFYRDPEYLAMAERAYTYLQEHFMDKKYDGMFWMVDAAGNPTQDKKQVYGQAFVIYALAEFHRASGSLEPLELAIRLFQLLEKYSYDSIYGGYIEALSREWEMTENLSLSSKDMNEKKSMNTHLHVLEAYTGLYRVWKSAELRTKLTELIDIMLKHIVDDAGAHFHLFLDEAWKVKSEVISYGHDIEGSWLLYEAAEVLGDPELLSRVQKVAVTMAEAVLAEGIDRDGGIWNEADNGQLVNKDKDWWPQAEAVVGFYNAYQLTGDTKFKDAAATAWAFICQYIVDHVHGEWHWGVDENLKPLTGSPKLSAWKCPYHNSRACFEMIERLTPNTKEHLS
ncbi:AGE family epimerase/isomerase [Paenibacillus sp. sgz500958]|uniref:AGE family epimerase/isomerase n=1 Tax=Paenibacillus sp. sgz500958 TaxID=3242475 RepID=UPI0036D36E16